MVTKAGFLAVASAFVLVVSGCSSGGSSAFGSPGGSQPESSVVQDEASFPVDCALPEIRCVGLVVGPGMIERPTLEPILDDHLAEVHVVEIISAGDSSEFELRVGAMIDKSMDLIIVSGIGGPELVTQAAQREPDLAFIAIGGLAGSELGESELDSQSPDNLFFIEFDLERAAFVAGAMAGLLTDSGKVGAVVASDADAELARFLLGWERGARFSNPEVELLTVFNPARASDRFNDPSWAAEATRGQLIQGVDVVLGVGGKTGNAALVEAARSQGATLCVGAVDDQYQATVDARPCLVASVVLEVGPVLGKALDRFVESGSSSGWVEGETALVMAPGNPLPEEISVRVSEIQTGLADGSIDPHAD